jgi:hypothetical protein
LRLAVRRQPIQRQRHCKIIPAYLLGYSEARLNPLRGILPNFLLIEAEPDKLDNTNGYEVAGPLPFGALGEIEGALSLGWGWRLTSPSMSAVSRVRKAGMPLGIVNSMIFSSKTI